MATNCLGQKSMFRMIGNCEWNSWSAWSACSNPCTNDESKRYRLRSVASEAQGVGICPGETREEEKCESETCGVPCNGGEAAYAGIAHAKPTEDCGAV